MGNEPDRSRYKIPNAWYLPHPGNQSTATPTVDTMSLWQFENPARMKVDQAAVDVAGAAAAGGILRLGIYGAVGGLPDFTTLLADFGTFDTTGTGIKTATLGAAVTLPRGLLFIATVAQVAAGSMRVVSGWSPPAMIQSLAAPSAGLAAICYTRTGVSGALPTSGVCTGMTSNLPTRVFLHAAA